MSAARTKVHSNDVCAKRAVFLWSLRRFEPRDAGLPDAIGATLLRVLGLYPPGSYVLLANGEVGVVTCRGAKGHTRVVAILVRASGAIVGRPHLRDTSLAEFVVQRSLSPTR